MREKSKKFIGYLILAGVVIFAFLAAGWVILFTQIGTAYIVKKISRTLSEKKEVVWQKNEGSFMGGMVYENVEIEDLEILPKPNILKIQKISVNIDSLSVDGISVSLENARLLLPNADPVLAYGSLDNGALDLNVYSKSLSLSEIETLIRSIDLNNVSGELSEVDIRVKGTLKEPQFEGDFIINKIAKDGFSLLNSPGTLSLMIKEENNAKGLSGTIVLQNGTISGKRTAIVSLKTSKIMFSGDPQKPSFDINGTSQVGNIKLSIALKGSFDKPDLQLKSDPPMEKDRLLLALATNKTWKNTEDILNKGVISKDIAKDFIDYFVFGGQGNKFAEKFGLKTVAIKYDGQGKGVAVTKDLSDKLEGKYEIEEKNKNETNTDIIQKIGGEYKVTENLSLEAKKELTQQYENTLLENSKTEDQLLL
ncbi:MAG: translocation/assembly module TamB, partial [Candidatus Omnitrophica bacterium]|nr:translocation/assembly module TamB [Candidatus Omnitrophota bacterium]